MASSQLIAQYRQWQTFQRQEQLSREHFGVVQRLEDARASSTQVVQAYRSMAEKASTEGACYRTLFLRKRTTNTPCPAKAGCLCAGCSAKATAPG